MPKKPQGITFRGVEQANDSFEASEVTKDQPRGEEGNIRYITLKDLNIEEIVVDGNNVIIENLNGDFGEIEIPEICFEDETDKQRQVENWL